MKLKKRMAFILVLIIAMLSMTTGCGKKEETTTEVTTEEATEASTAVTTEATTQEEKTYEELGTVDSGDRTFVKTNGVHQEGETTLTYLGHASVKIVTADGTVIYIDPNYKDADYSDEADIVLVTHGHDDHMPCKAVVMKEDATEITWREAHPSPDVYEKFEINGIEIEAVPATNINHNIDSCVGYIITVDGIKIYHAGDTSMIDSMGELTGKEIDFAMYPIDGEYNMDAQEASEVANLVNAKYNIPIHEFDQGDTRKSDNFQPNSRLVLEYGDTIIISD